MPRRPRRRRAASPPPALPTTTAWATFADRLVAEGSGAERVADLREERLRPAGRAEISLFSTAPGDPRSHPRLRITLPPPAEDDWRPRSTPGPASASEVAPWLEAAWHDHKAEIEAPEPADSPVEGRRLRANQRRGQRVGRLFTALGATLAESSRGWPADQQRSARYDLAVALDLAHARPVQFDNEDTGTYHSFGHDAPFVHYLEVILASLPADGSPAMALLDAEAQAAVARQRQQAQAHLDHLMRHKYAHDGIREADIERSLGGRLIDRTHRAVASERLDTVHSLRPSYELLRVDPASSHPAAGAWVYRDGSILRRQDGAPVQVSDEALLSVPVEAADLTFARAPHSPLLRANVRFDWDGNGHVQSPPIAWVDWAGHCDVKAVLEAAGITLSNRPSVIEHRSDTGQTTVYNRDLLLEMLASLIELGSTYQRLDGSGALQLGEHRFGGARNDSRPDRLQLQGLSPGRSLRWPLSGRQESWTVVGIEDEGGSLDLGTAFQRCIPVDKQCRFIDNPRFLKTVEGDYNLISVAGCLLTVDLLEESIDPVTGYPTSHPLRTTVDLRPDSAQRRSYLGAALRDASAREQYRAWYDADAVEVQVELWRFVRQGDRYEAQVVPEGTVTFPLLQPLIATLSREQRLDEPAAFQALLDLALRQGQGICVDTDEAAAVWNGVLLGARLDRLEVDRAARTERWQLRLDARFGDAALRYLVRRDEEGRPQAFCAEPAPDDTAPDFLWQDLPDVGAKAWVNGAWVVNATLVQREMIGLRPAPTLQGGVRVDDEHLKNVCELLWCGLAGRRFTLVHHNARFAFTEESAWQREIDALAAARSALISDTAPTLG